MSVPARAEEALKVLDAHYQAFFIAKKFADPAGHPVPSETRAWSQILVSVLTGTKGRQRKKGSDLADGSDVKAANCWSAIDTPRFNGCIPSGRKTAAAAKRLDVTALDDTPFIYFVMWDESPATRRSRCRVWCVRAQTDRVFRKVCATWYARRADGIIRSDNFQLHPPRNLPHDIVRNECGNLLLPLLFAAEHDGERYHLTRFTPEVLTAGVCTLIPEEEYPRS